VGETSSQSEEPPFVPRNAVYQYTYDWMYLNKEFYPTHYLDVKDFKKMGIYDRTIKFLEGANLHALCTLEEKSYKKLTIEFLSSLKKVATSNETRKTRGGDY